MGSQWPPSPSVEDEEAALSREYLIDTVVVKDAKNINQPADNRGTVNQYPIILDPVKDLPDLKRDVGEANSSDDSPGPRTPPPIYKDPIRSTTTPDGSQASTPKANRKESRSKSRTRKADRAESRGRPDIARIQTNLGNDVENMATGKRRPPSPYAYRPSPVTGKPEPYRRFSGEQLLSPESASFTRGSDRPKSTPDHVIAQSENRSSLRTGDESEDDRQRRRQHSRRRSTTPAFAEPLYVSKDTLSNTTTATSRRDPARTYDGRLAGHRQDGTVENLAYRDPRRLPEVEYDALFSGSRSSAAKSRESGRSSTTPQSSEDESKRRREKTLSRRPSSYRPQRPQLEPLLHGQSFSGWEAMRERPDMTMHRNDPKHHPVFDGRTYLEPTSPPSGHSVEAMEEMMERAFRDNQSKRSSGAIQNSGNVSPYASPVRTPPQAPREQRHPQVPEPASPLGRGSLRPSRHPSIEHTYYPNPRLSSASINPSIPITAPTSVPSLSRSTTSSYDPNLGYRRSEPLSGLKSRKQSPTFDDPRPTSRAGSDVRQEYFPLNRSSTFVTDTSRPTSRAGPGPQDVLEQPKPIQRASSYNAAIPQSSSRPGSSQRMSSSFLPQSAFLGTSNEMAGTKYATTAPVQLVNTEQSGGLLPPACARSTPQRGLMDWYTVKGIPEIDICPSCVSILANSRFHDSFIPGLPKAPTLAVKCALGNPWMRVAWVQIHKQNRSSLNLLGRLINRPPTTRPCPGRKLEMRSWCHMTDPATKRPILNFQVCTSCVYALDTIFPCLDGVLDRTDSLLQELSCSMNFESRRFSKFISEFEKAHQQCRGKLYRTSNIQSLAEHARITCRTRECSRDLPIASSTWHFLPDLPDFTICDECFHEVVWPLVELPVARDVHLNLRLVPTSRPGQFRNGRTCQLYSDRMRTVFREAAKRDDLDALRAQATKRLDTEQLLQERHASLMSEMWAGYDRTAELERLAHIWKTWE